MVYLVWDAFIKSCLKGMRVFYLSCIWAVDLCSWKTKLYFYTWDSLRSLKVMTKIERHIWRYYVRKIWLLLKFTSAAIVNRNHNCFTVRRLSSNRTPKSFNQDALYMYTVFWFVSLLRCEARSLESFLAGRLEE